MSPYNNNEEVVNDLEYLVDCIYQHLKKFSSIYWSPTEWAMYDALVETNNWPDEEETRP